MTANQIIEKYTKEPISDEDTLHVLVALRRSRKWGMLTPDLAKLARALVEAKMLEPMENHEKGTL